MIEELRVLRRYWGSCRYLGGFQPGLFPYCGGPVWHRDYVNGFVSKLALFPLPRSAKCVVDVGANVGLFSKAAELYCPEARVIALEPSKTAFDQLRARCGPRVEAVKTAVGAEPGEAILHIAEHLASSSLRPPGEGEPGWDNEKQRAAGPTETVPVTTLDQLSADRSLGRIDLLKIDVEGFEPEVIRGGGKTIANDVDRVLVEVSFGRLGSEKAMEIIEGFLRDGFKLVNIADVAREGSVPVVDQFDAWFAHPRVIGE